MVKKTDFFGHNSLLFLSVIWRVEGPGSSHWGVFGARLAVSSKQLATRKHDKQRSSVAVCCSNCNRFWFATTYWYKHWSSLIYYQLQPVVGWLWLSAIWFWMQNATRKNSWLQCWCHSTARFTTALINSSYPSCSVPPVLAILVSTFNSPDIFPHLLTKTYWRPQRI